jgi:hypothetical protein
MTLNLIGGLGPLTHIPLHTPVSLLTRSIVFPTIRFGVDYTNAAVWESPQPAAPALPPAEILDRFRRVALAAVEGRGPSPLTVALLAWFGAVSSPDGPAEAWRADLVRLQAALFTGQAPAVSAVLEGFLGRGSGLTPSGDDLVMGVLLVLSRWGSARTPAIDLEALARSLLLAARRSTTALSAGLIECAAAGQTDERLTLALDGIVSGTVEVDRCAQALRGWGSSSGLDALAGMAVALVNI